MANKNAEYSQLAKNIRSLRLYMGYTQKQLASLFGVTHSALAAWEIDNGTPSTTAWIEAHNNLGITFEDFNTKDFTLLLSKENDVFKSEINTKLFSTLLKGKK